MPSSNKTPLGFNLWSGTDQPKKDDFNSDNILIDNQVTALDDRIDTLDNQVTALDDRKPIPTVMATFVSSSGGTDYFTATSPEITTLSNQMIILLHLNQDNTGKVSVNINTGESISLMKIVNGLDVDLDNGDLNQSVGYLFQYSGGVFSYIGDSILKADIEYVNEELANKVNILDMDIRIPNYVTFDILHSSGWHVQNGMSQSARTITTTMTNLQATIDSLPKYLDRNVTINVSAGTISTSITISNFTGHGELYINGASAIATTHNCLSFVINRCSNVQIAITGFNTTHVSSPSFSLTLNACAIVYINYCSSTAGLNTNSTNIGISCVYTTRVVVSNCAFSNKYTAIQSSTSLVSTANLSGSGNNYVYAVNGGGSIHKTTVGSIVGSTLHTLSSAGLIVNPSGATIGT